jgi:hypothetical protein
MALSRIGRVSSLNGETGLLFGAWGRVTEHDSGQQLRRFSGNGGCDYGFLLAGH